MNDFKEVSGASSKNNNGEVSHEFSEIKRKPEKPLVYPPVEERVAVKVYGLSRFSSFNDLFSVFDRTKFGHKEGIKLEEQVQGMYDVYKVEDEVKYGVLGIHIKLLDKIPEID